MSSLDKVRVPGGVLLSRAVFGDRFVAVDQDSVLLPLAEGRGVVHPHTEIRPIDAYIDKDNV